MVVGFSCKGRGFCPSCTGRRMADTSARLVDDVFPDDVPVRQAELIEYLGFNSVLAKKLIDAHIHTTSQNLDFPLCIDCTPI